MICGNVKHQRFILATGLSLNKPRQAVFSPFTFIHPQPENKSTYQVVARIACPYTIIRWSDKVSCCVIQCKLSGEAHTKIAKCFFLFFFILSKLFFNHLLARGRWELSWALPSGLSGDQVHVEESRCGRTSTLYCSVVTVSRSQVQHTGQFRCRYRHRTRRQTSIYVYVTGKKLQLLPESAASFLFSGARREGPHSFTPSCLLFISPG